MPTLPGLLLLAPLLEEKPPTASRFRFKRTP